MRPDRIRTLTGTAVALLILLAAPAATLAGELTEGDTKNFIAAMDEVKTLQKKLEERGQKDKLLADMTPKAGEPFRPFAKAVTILEETDAELYGELSGMTGKHGFDAPTDWAATGDRILLAYASIKIGEDPQAKAMMEQLTPEMMEQVPPNMRAQFEGMMALMGQIEEVDPDDVAIVRKFQPELDRVMNVQAVGPMGGGPMGGR